MLSWEHAECCYGNHCWSDGKQKCKYVFFDSIYNAFESFILLLLISFCFVTSWNVLDVRTIKPFIKYMILMNEMTLFVLSRLTFVFYLRLWNTFSCGEVKTRRTWGNSLLICGKLKRKNYKSNVTSTVSLQVGS